MNFNEYQEQAKSTAVYPNQGSNPVYTLLGLCGELGELAEKFLNLMSLVSLEDMSNPHEIDAYWTVIEVLENFVDGAKDCELLKKFIRDNEDNERYVNVAGLVSKTITSDYHDKLTAELGDTLWYSSQFANELGVKFGDVATWNINKLKSRKDRNVLHGSGDER